MREESSHIQLLILAIAISLLLHATGLIILFYTLGPEPTVWIAMPTQEYTPTEDLTVTQTHSQPAQLSMDAWAHVASETNEHKTKPNSSEKTTQSVDNNINLHTKPTHTINKKRISKQKSPISLKSFVQKFLHHADNGKQTSTTNSSSDGIAMHGARSGKASVAQLILRRYAQKIILALQTRFRAHRHALPMNLIRKSDPIEISVQLDKSGKLLNVALMRSSGFSDLDTFALAIFYDTQGSYPSIPDELMLPQYTLIIQDLLNVFHAPVSASLLKQK